MLFSLLTMEANNMNPDQASEQETNYPEQREKGNLIAALKRHCIG